MAGGAGQAADVLAPLGAAAEAVRAVAATANDSEAGIASFADAGSSAAASLTNLFEIANDNQGFASITAATGEAADGLERLGGTGSAALAALVQPATEAETAVAGLAPIVDGAGQALADLLGAAGNTEGLNQLAQATAGVGEAFSSITAGERGLRPRPCRQPAAAFSAGDSADGNLPDPARCRPRERRRLAADS